MEYTNLSETAVIKKVSEKGSVGIFNIEGLYTGYGLTIGNSMRRVLLSSLPGAAIVQIKIKGVEHEFSTLPGMIENIVELSLNLKKVRFIMSTDEPQSITLNVKGAKDVTAGDIKETTFVEVANKELKIATLTKKNSELDMEITVEKGLGYLPSEQRKTGRLPVGTIMLDAIFSPVIRVDFGVEDMRVGEKTNYNRVTLEVETDGTIAPTYAVKTASEILREHFEKMCGLSTGVSVEMEKKLEEKKKSLTKKKTEKSTKLKDTKIKKSDKK